MGLKLKKILYEGKMKKIIRKMERNGHTCRPKQMKNVTFRIFVQD